MHTLAALAEARGEDVGRARAADRRERDGRVRPVNVVPKKALGQHFLVDENILGVIERLAELQAGRRRARDRAGPRRAHALPRRRGSRTSTRSSSTARSSRSLATFRARRSTGQDALALDLAALEPPAGKLVANLPYNVATPIVVESLDRLPDDRAVVRDGAARGRRPVLRRLRERRPTARSPSCVQLATERTGLPSGVARGLPPAAERRVGARRVPARRARHRPGREATRRGGVRAPAQDARELARARGRRIAASRPQPALEAIGREPAPAPRSSSRPSSSPSQPRSHDSAPAPAKINLALVVGADAARTACTRSRRSSSGSTSRHGLARAGRRALGRRVRRRHDRPPRPRGGRRGARQSSRAGAPRIEKRIPVAAGPRRRQLRRGDRARARLRRLLASRRRDRALATLARGLGVDVPFFLEPGPAARARRRRDARAARPAAGLHRPAPAAARRAASRRPPRSTAASTARTGFDERRACVLEVAHAGRAADLAALPPNDLATLAALGPAARARRVPGRRQRRRARPCTASSRDRAAAEARRARSSAARRDLDHGPSVVAFVLRWLPRAERPRQARSRSPGGTCVSTG